MLFQNKVALVTGGSRGIGKAIVEAISKQGATVYFTYVNQTSELEKQTQESEQLKIYPEKCDISDFESVKKLLEKIQNKHGAVDLVVNNAGITRDKPLVMMTPDDWNQVIGTNLTGTFNVCRCAVVEMMKKKSGKIVNITSVSGITGLPRQSNYSASKAGIIGFTKAMAKELAGYGITVNAVAPGFIETDMVSKLAPKFIEDSKKQVPLKRFGTTNEVAELVTYLFSQAADYITGEIIKLDGGMVI